MEMRDLKIPKPLIDNCSSTTAMTALAFIWETLLDFFKLEPIQHVTPCNRKICASHKTRSFAEQVNHGRSRVLWNPKSSDRRCVLKHGQEHRMFHPQSIRHGRQNDTRRDNIDSNLLLSKLNSKWTSKTLHSNLLMLQMARFCLGTLTP